MRCVNIYRDDEGRFISDGDYNSIEELREHLHIDKELVIEQVAILNLEEAKKYEDFLKGNQ